MGKSRLTATSAALAALVAAAPARHLRATPRRRTLGSALALTIVVATAAVGPASADAELGHTGEVGPHALRDADIYHPGADCRYKTLSESERHWEGLLKRIDVRPPKMRSVVGRQRVGWRFLVQRSFLYGERVWTTTYRSPIQKGTADPDVKASFDPMSVRVRVPADSWDDPYIYRVRVKMFWYRPDGSVEGTAKHGVDHYGGGAGAGWDYCVGHPHYHGD